VTQFPPVSAALLAALEVAFPATNPRPNETLGPIQYRAGSRAVVEFLKSHHANQQKLGKDVSLIPFPS